MKRIIILILLMVSFCEAQTLTKNWFFVPRYKIKFGTVDSSVTIWFDRTVNKLKLIRNNVSPVDTSIFAYEGTLTGGWVLSGTTPAKIYQNPGIKIHIRNTAGDTTGTGLFNLYDDPFTINGLTYNFPATRFVGSVPYDSLGNGTIIWRHSPAFLDKINTWASTNTFNGLLQFGGSGSLKLPTADQTSNIGYLWRDTDSIKYTNSVGTVRTFPFGTGTTNELTYWSSTNGLGTLPTASYPNLTELSYVKGVTSGIQAQINGKVSGIFYPLEDGKFVKYSSLSGGLVGTAYNENSFLTSEVDGSTTNEIQTLGTSGNNITLTSGGSVTAPYATNAGTAVYATSINSFPLAASVWSYNGLAQEWKPLTDFTNASNLSSGTVGTARLGTGTANSSTVLRGNNTWGNAPLADYANALGSSPMSSSVWYYNGSSQGWQNVIPVANLGTGTPSGSNFLRGDGTWATPTSVDQAANYTWTGTHTFTKQNFATNATLVDVTAGSVNTSSYLTITGGEFKATAGHARHTIYGVRGLATGITSSESSVIGVYGNAQTGLYNFAGYFDNGLVYIKNQLYVGGGALAPNFEINAIGQLTKVANLAASSNTNKVLMSDGTSYTPTDLFGRENTWTALNKFDAVANPQDAITVLSGTVSYSASNLSAWVKLETNGGNREINTLSSPTDGQVVTFYSNDVSYYIQFTESGSTNGFLLAGTSFTMYDGDTITLRYSSTKSRWLEISRSDN